MPRKLSRKTVLVSGAVAAAAALGGGAVIAQAVSRGGEEPEEEATGMDPAPSTDERESWIEETLAGLSLEDKVGQLFMVYVKGESADTGDPDAIASNQERLGVDNGAAFVSAYRPGGIIYFDWANGLSDPAAVNALSNGLQDAAAAEGAVPLLIATDQEYGTVVRIQEPATQFPGSMALGATRDADAARTAAEIAGGELRAMGLNLNFAPDADVNVDPANPVIGVRSFGSDPGLVAEMAAAQVGGYQSGGVATCAKHFPGHGDTGTDSHTALPVITHSAEEWERIDLPPFQAAIDAGTDLVMTAHLQFPALDDSLAPATLSEPILTGILRERLGYDGVVITDSLEMEGVRTEYGDDRVPVLALLAGADMLLMPPDFPLAHGAVLDAVASGELTEDRIDESVRRLLGMKFDRGIVDDPGTDPDAAAEVGSDEHHAVAADIAERSITLLANDGTLPFAGASVLVTGWGENTTARLAEALEGQGLRVDTLVTGEEPDAAAIEAAASAAAGHDLVVVTTFKVRSGSAQAGLVAALLEGPAPVVAAAVGTPYDAGNLPDANASLATYSYTRPALTALAQTITGATAPTGTLPVEVPGASGDVLYPFGHGLNFD